MTFTSTRFKDLYIISPKVVSDDRGWFMRTFDLQLFEKKTPSFGGQWKQMNHSFNIQKGTFRGLHYQDTPYQEAKCVRCISGGVIDYALDLRKNSDTFLQVFEIELSAANKNTIYIPKGFAHGFFTLQDNSELIYLHDEYYASNHDRGVYYQDKMIKTSINITPIEISEKDKNHPPIEKEFKGI